MTQLNFNEPAFFVCWVKAPINNKIALIKSVRTWTGCGLREAKDLVDIIDARACAFDSTDTIYVAFMGRPFDSSHAHMCMPQVTNEELANIEKIDIIYEPRSNRVSYDVPNPLFKLGTNERVTVDDLITMRDKIILLREQLKELELERLEKTDQMNALADRLAELGFAVV